MVKFRRITFYLFAAVYLFFCPLIILYSLGYLFKPGTEPRVVKTGLLYLSTTPPGASVTLEKTIYPEETPTIIRDLLPGHYRVTVILKGHKPWLQTIRLTAGESTVFEKILLVPEIWKAEELSDDSFEKLFPVAGSSLFLLSTGPHAENYLVYDTEENILRPLFPNDFPFKKAQVSSIRTVRGSSSFLIFLDSKPKEALLWIQPKEKEFLIKDLSDVLPEKPNRVQWDAREKRYLWIFQDGSINRLDMDSHHVTPRFMEHIRGMGLFQKTIYVLTDEGVFVQVDENGTNEKVILNDPMITQDLFGKKENFDIHVISKNLILFLGRRGELLANRLPYRFIEKGVRGFEFDPDHQRLLFWLKDKIGVLDFSKDSSKSGPFEQGPKLSWIYQKGQDIQQGFWVHDGSHVLFRDRDEIFLADLETQSSPLVDLLFHIKKGTSLLSMETTGKLYFLEQKSGRLVSVDLLPGEKFLLPLSGKNKENPEIETQKQ